MTLAEWAPLGASAVALTAAAGSYWASRRKPDVDDATARKIKAEMRTERQAADATKALADAKRDRHIVALEEWAFRQVRPKWRIATIIVDDQNALLVKLAGLAKIAYEPRQLPELPPMPEIDK
jgi:hypothetical protein